MINSTLMSAFNDRKIMKDVTIRCEVEMKPSAMLGCLAENLLAELQRLAPYAGYKPVSDLEVEDILKYLKSLVWMRCARVQTVPIKAFKEYQRLYSRLEVPVLLYQLLISMGIAYDADYALEFYPSYQIEGSDLLSPDELLAISNVMRSLGNVGFKSVTGCPREITGELDFMALCHVKEVVCGYRDSHPVYGFLMSFFAQEELNKVTGLMCRNVYGYDADYRVYVNQLMNFGSVTPPDTHDA